MNVHVNASRVLFDRDPMIYGQFLEHFHRQVYSGVFEPGSPLSDAEGFREDVIEALRELQVPVVRWPGGCFVSSYHWRKGVGERVPVYDKSWRVEEPNTFGTDEFIRFCEKIGCAPYICTNAGTGGAEEMSDWLEYCNLDHEGEFARLRIANGHRAPYRVPYWSIGNENYGGWEIGAKTAEEWARLVLEASKMMKRVDPECSLSAAALPDAAWNLALLQAAGERLDWVSVHAYWDGLQHVDAPADYAHCMGFTRDLDRDIRRVRGLLCALGLEKRVKIAFDEWNLRGWHHPNIHTVYQGRTKDEYLTPRDLNDRNTSYTMADAVFTACFLNTLHRNADIVRMANYSPVVNTRGLLYAYKGGVVRRSTFYVFKLYAERMLDQVLDVWTDEETIAVPTAEGEARVTRLDAVATRDASGDRAAVALVHKHETEPMTTTLRFDRPVAAAELRAVNGERADDFNDVDREPIRIREMPDDVTLLDPRTLRVTLAPHSVNVVSVTFGA